VPTEAKGQKRPAYVIGNASPAGTKIRVTLHNVKAKRMVRRFTTHSKSSN
jgi:hypothetical protein